MPYAIVYDPDTAIITTTITGTLNAEEAYAVSVLTQQTAAQYSCKRFLTDMRETIFLLPAGEGHQHTTSLADRGYERTDRMAVVHAPQDSDRFQLMETAAQNRGWNYRVFTDIEEAVAWLSAS